MHTPHLVDFLIGVPPESDPIVERHLSEQNKLHNTIFNAIKNILINKSLDDAFDTTLTPQEMVEKVYKDYLKEHSITLGSDTEKYLLDSIVGEFVGFGLLEPLLNDASISEVRVMGLYDISIIRNGKQEKVSMYFEDLDHLWRIITRFTAPMDMNVTEREPFKQFRMPNNNIVTVVHSSIVYHGPFLTIIKPV